MIYKISRIVALSFIAIFLSCQDKESREGSEKEILPAEEKKDELRDDERPMSRSYLLAKMRENEELSAFTEEFKRSGLEEEFEGEEGIYTIFAPSNAAYDRIPAKEMDPEGGTDLRYYMVEGEMTIDNLRQRIRSSEDGRYEFRTALGEKLWATEEGGKIVLIDVLGNKASIVTSSLNDHYGVYHVIDNVLQSGDGSQEETK